MVGLNEFGEAAWSLEQLLNSWLADQKSANEVFRNFCAARFSTGFEQLDFSDISSGEDRDSTWLR